MSAGARKSDLGVRTLSAIVMLAVAAVALWLGGVAFTALVALVALGVLWEFWGLIRGFASSLSGRLLWLAFAVVYVGLAACALWDIRTHWASPVYWTLLLLMIVWATDIGAYFAGRTIGGPKIAPRLSPSKTWAGLLGGIAASMAVVAAMVSFDSSGIHGASKAWWLIPALGIPLPVIAQVGDFFESGLKRAAGVKDSGAFIPGHGGLFDRVDGLLAAAIFYALYMRALA